MPTNRSSEWYLPDAQNYKDFIVDVLMFISVQRPEPEEAYHFKVSGTGKNQKLIREHKEQFIDEASLDDKIEYKRDYVAQKKVERARLS